VKLIFVQLGSPFRIAFSNFVAHASRLLSAAGGVQMSLGHFRCFRLSCVICCGKENLMRPAPVWC
jgi:hypothetical protein